MEEEFRYRGRLITAAEVEFIRQLMAQHPGTNRRQLSLWLCEARGWKQVNGAPRDMVCRGLLLELQRAGHLELPPVRHVHRNPATRRARHGGEGLLHGCWITLPWRPHCAGCGPWSFSKCGAPLRTAGAGPPGRWLQGRES